MDKLSWIAIYPEVVLLVMGCAIALIDLGVKSRLRTATYGLTILTLLVVAYLTGLNANTGITIYAWNDMVVSDPMGNWLKCFAALALIVTLIYGRPYAADRGMLRGGEMFVLGLLSLLGAFVLIGGNHFLVLYLGLELLTLSSYVLVALRRDDGIASEAAMKYFILGAMASGFLLYGLSMLYGATGSLNVGEVYRAVASGHVNHQVLVFGLVFIVAGVSFKFGAVPFHMWIPDVYQGAPTAVTLMIGAAPKLAAFAMAVRLLIEALLPLALEWQQMLGLLAIASLLIGNLAAVSQTNVKRMLAYSTIAQVGFILLGLMAGVAGVPGTNQSSIAWAPNAYSSSMFYVVTYVLTTLASFGVVMLLSRAGFESEHLSDFAGLNQRSPLYAAIMAICMFSLAGIPPMVGFQAKLSVLQALIAGGQPSHIALAVFAVVMSLIGAFYYIRVVKVMYFDAPNSLAGAITAPFEVRAVLSLNGLLILLLGILPGALMSLCSRAIVHMLSS